MATVPTQAKVVVIGAGIVGNSLVHHLAQLGWRDIVQLDKGPLPNPGGSTGHASNFIFPVDHSREITDLTLDSMRQYKEMGVFTESGGAEPMAYADSIRRAATSECARVPDQHRSASGADVRRRHAARAIVNGGSVTMETRQSIVLLPKVPMRPRHADARVGYFSVDRVNYGLDVQKAASETFITRWRLEPKDPAAYARGELVEPVKPIVYYIDPATPTRWVRYVKQGVEDWQEVFEKAGFKNAILRAKDRPRPKTRISTRMTRATRMVRWAASLTRNATGPHTHDPRSGEIINSEITWYHNHMRSYRNWLIMETGAANPAARTLDIPEELMGETMRQVITHEIGHALGLQHNMIASASFPVDSLRSPSFTRQVRRERDDHGLRATELRRAAGRRPRDEGLHPPPRTLR